MGISISSSGQGSISIIDPRFARCGVFAVYYTDALPNVKYLNNIIE